LTSSVRRVSVFVFPLRRQRYGAYFSPANEKRQKRSTKCFFGFHAQQIKASPTFEKVDMHFHHLRVYFLSMASISTRT
ncbi:hypothetical protein, partial [Bacteroides heparinolyticus]|uniref:hypothetical protein n=1 Tax=Prevotella heparinolytica TaxID=28113 RepID=UPI0035A1775B